MTWEILILILANGIPSRTRQIPMNHRLQRQTVIIQRNILPSRNLSTKPGMLFPPVRSMMETVIIRLDLTYMI